MFDTPAQAAFRTRIRSRVATRNGQQLSRERIVAWHEILAGEGLLVPHWPLEWGGQGWSVPEQMIYDEEVALNDAPELNSITFDMIGPVLMRYGSQAQKDRFLPAIASGRQWWCQGYSEPRFGEC